MARPIVKARHIIEALKRSGFERVAVLAESIADEDQADELEALANQLPVTGEQVRDDAQKLRRRAKRRLED